MRIAIDVSSVVYGTGVSMYTRNLVKALAKVGGENEYMLFAGTWRQKDEIFKYIEELKEVKGVKFGENFQLKIFPIPPRAQAKLWNDWHVLGLENLIGPHDVYHSVDWSLAPTQAKTVITVHDLFFLKRPDLQRHPYRETLEIRIKRARDKRIKAIAVSNATKKDLVELLDYPEELVTVVYEASDPSFKFQVSSLELNKILKKYDISQPYLLMVGTREPRKNLERTIEAFLTLRRPETFAKLKLVIAGKVGWGEGLHPSENVQLLGYVPQEDLPALYANTEGFLYPSLYEGFGIPILEAFACGAPVLTSNVSSMPEVAGSAAIYVDPHDVNSIREGMEKMLNLSTTDKNRLVQNGYKQMRKFSWEKAAKEMLKVYETL